MTRLAASSPLADSAVAAAPGPAVRRAPRFSVLGVRVDAVQIAGAIARMRDWIAAGRTGHFVAVTGMHGVIESRRDSQFKRALAEADLVVPDGMPLVWIGRWRGHSLARRVYGPELLLQFCRDTPREGYRHYFYGGAPGVAEQVAARLAQLCPGIRIAGTWCPPFRALTAAEEAEVVRSIRDAAPDVLWVGLGTPKQEAWMLQHRDLLGVPVLVGVGAAFDFLAARKRQAPAWMREHGLEWLFRLLQEPRRLWRRYLVGGAEFVVLVALELLGWRRFE